MKKKIVMVIAVLGMGFAGIEVNAQNEGARLAGGGSGSDAWTTFYDVNLGGGIRLIGCAGPPTNCLPEVVITGRN